MNSERMVGLLWQRLAIVGVLLLAAALRWLDLGLVEFKYDEAHITGMALAIVQGGDLPLLSGGTSVGVLVRLSTPGFWPRRWLSSVGRRRRYGWWGRSASWPWP